MSDDQTTDGKALAAQGPQRAPREYRVVESAMGIMDTSRFEHLGRVAQVMARAGLMPQTLTHHKPEGARADDPLLPLPHEVVVARAYLIANQADLWNADPMAVAQCTSLVHGKLMYEGKLVHGIISAKLGVDLRYEFGRYKLDLRDIAVGDMPGGDDQALGVRVSGTLPGETEPRTVSGSVAMWHKGAKSPWGAAAAWPRQLRYMGAREWARAHKPSLLLGIITDDEIEEYELARAVGAVAPAAPQMLHAGFSDVRTAQIEGPAAAKKSSRAKIVDKANAAEKPETGPAEADAATSTGDAEQTAQEAAVVALDGDDLPGSLKGVPEASTLRTIVAGLEVGHAEPDEVYLHAEDSVLTDGKWLTFQNGSRFSSVAESGAAALSLYAEHAPEAPDPVDDEGQDEIVVEDDQNLDVNDQAAAQEDEEEVLPPELRSYVERVEGATSWVKVKEEMATFYRSPYFSGLSPAAQNSVRANTWDVVQNAEWVDEDGHPATRPDQAGDVSAYRLWIEWEEDPEAIKGTLAVLERQKAFADKEFSFKDAIRNATGTRLTTLRG